MRINGGNGSSPLGPGTDGIWAGDAGDAKTQNTAGVTDAGSRPVFADGRTSDGRDVAWITPGNDDVADRAANILLNVLGDFGPRITQSIARELGLDPIAGKLDERSVEQVMSMARTHKDVFSGANFFVRLHFSAEGRSAAFQSACVKTRTDPGRLGADVLKEIDRRFGEALNDASRGNREPLDVSDGERLMLSVLERFASDADGTPPR